MKWLSGRSLVWVAALLLLAPGASHADPYTNWSFTWAFDPIAHNAAGFVPATSGPAAAHAATGGASFAAQSGDTGGSTIPVALVSTTSSATTAPDTFQHAAFTADLKITDNATHASGTLTFDGHLNGSLTASKSAAVGTFSLDPNSPSSLSLGGHTYRAAISSPLSLPSPGASPRQLNATVLVGAAGPPPPPPTPQPPTPQPHSNGGGTPVTPTFQSAPEPSALALAGIAATAFALARRRRGSPAPQAS